MVINLTTAIGLLEILEISVGAAVIVEAMVGADIMGGAGVMVEAVISVALVVADTKDGVEDMVTADSNILSTIDSAC
jgi:hypothetical protein